MKQYFMALGLCSLGLWLGLGSAAIASPANNKSIQAVFDHSALKKISFNIDTIDANGLVGLPQSQRSLMYEFCIPSDTTHAIEIHHIDPTIQLSRSRGRIGCHPNEYLAIGNTHNPQWREILFAIARLDYVRQINEFFGE